MRLLQQLNPRLHIAAAIGWAVFLVVTLAALVTANFAATEAEHRARVDAEGLLAEFATQVRDALSMQLETRRSLLQATAAQIVAAGETSPAAMLRNLEVIRGRFPEFDWLGVVNGEGRVVAGTSGRFVGEEVAASPWFQQGRQRPFVGEANISLTSGTKLPAVMQRQPPMMHMAVPLSPSAGQGAGAMVAHVSWSWVETVLSRMQSALSARRQVEVMLADRDGAVLAGPQAWLGHKIEAASDFTEGGQYVAGTRAQLRLADGLGLGWTAIVRQRADSALAPVRATRRIVFLIVFFAGLLSAGAAVWVTRVLTRRLTTLANAAEAVQRGQQRTLTAPSGADEVSRIGATLSQVVDRLQTEKQALQTLNAELDTRVAERTQRIERMADEARHAAVTRERLRIARDLHDTLAHSLMALLTQIRLVRKLRTRMDEAELDAELGRAEEVAGTGLSGARNAIQQMRDNGVLDMGLGPAVQDMVRRFGQRTGVAVTLDAQPPCSTWADDRAGTLFRIIEEALRNVERHAQSSEVRISMSGRASSEGGDTGSVLGQRALVQVEDNGIGFDSALPRPGHYGLRGMREQAALIDAQLDVRSAPGKGTRIVISFDC